jgi:chitinase
MLRLTILLVVIAGVAFGAWKLVTGNNAAAAARSDATPVYAPYVDVTLTPTYPFQLPSANPVSGVYLGFIVSDPTSACTPSWGGYYTLGQAAQSLDIDARIDQLRSQGGQAMVSYGGQANTELAVDCTDAAQLASAYLAPIQRYHSTTIDLDIEGASLADTAADARRAVAIATVQRELAAKHRQLHVWMTLPVSASGLTNQGEAAVRAMLAAHVNLTGVNAMAMDFGPGQGAATNLLGTIERSLYATHTQVQSLFSTRTARRTAGYAWAHLGATVMLGVNDVGDERFTITDARRLTRFADHYGLPRVSVWSLNRDSECGSAFAQVGVTSNSCSGVRQSTLEFTHIFSRLRGTTIARTPAGGVQQPPVQTSSSNDPATSPYPIWQAAAAYVTGYKVVWNGQIYQASYWSQGTPPDSATSSGSNPWQLIGPVPPGSHAPKLILLNKATHRAWSPKTVYHQGDIVESGGLPFEARYYTRGSQPLKTLPANPSSPWDPLFTAPGEPNDTGIGSGTH